MKQSKQDGKALVFFAIAIAVFLIDRVTKSLAHEIRGRVTVITDFLYLTKSTNTGAAFSMLEGQNSMLLFVSVIVLGLILYHYQKIPAQKLPLAAFALIAGGAAGNIIDRVLYSHVVDFISFTFWPSFNIADSAITTGGIMAAVWILKLPK